MCIEIRGNSDLTFVNAVIIERFKPDIVGEMGERVGVWGRRGKGVKLCMTIDKWFGRVAMIYSEASYIYIDK